MWIPGQKIESGKVWFCFSKWDRGFVHFCQGKSLDLRRDKEGASVDTVFMADLLDRRQKACNAAVAAATHISDDEAELPKKRPKKKSQRKASMRHASLAPHSVEVELPPVTTEDGLQLEARKVSVLFEGAGTGTLWLELTKENVEHVRRGIISSLPNTERKRKTSQGGSGSQPVEESQELDG